MDDSEDENVDLEASDRLFEEYIRQNNNQAEEFNTELPTEHSYLGAMESVHGLVCFEVNNIYKIPIYAHHSLLFPGEVVPMIIAESFFDESIFGNDENDGLSFGLVFWSQSHNAREKNIVYGVTCQVYEKRRR